MQKGKVIKIHLKKKIKVGQKMHLKKIKVNKLALSGIGIYCIPMIME